MGAFVGMSSSLVMPSILFITGASIVSSLVWILFTEKIPSFGGKAGFTAFLGVLIVSLFDFWNQDFYNANTITSETVIVIVFVAMIATIATFAVRSRIKKRKGEAVIGSAVVGIVPGFFRMFFPGIATLSEVAFASSFAGMTDFKLLKENYYPILIGLIVGVVFFLSTPYFQGFGGKLGTIAFISVIVFLYMIKG